jgi:ADP-ribose pyrophosphatase YjhB (NUDIX family)
MADQRLDDQALTEAEFLQQYDPAQFDRPSVTVDAVICTVTDEGEADIRRVPDKVLRVLMVKRSGHPFRGRWALPGGFVGINESLDAAVSRILKRETGLDHIYLEQLYTWGSPERDPRTRVISVSYLALVDASTLRVQAGGGTTDARWYAVREQTLRTERVETGDRSTTDRTVQLTLGDGESALSALLTLSRTTEGRVTRTERWAAEGTEIAFDHATIISYALERLRSKLEWTDIAFNLVPELFTIKELQKVYETILGREILDMQFRRDIDRMVAPTNEMRINVGHRPARLFRFRPGWRED